MKYFVILTLLLFVSTVSAQNEPSKKSVEIVTVCDVLNNRASFNGKVVAIVGRWTATDEGFWLTDDCANQIKTDDYVWRNFISLEYDPSSTTALENGLELDMTAIKKKAAEMKARLKYSNKKFDWAVVFGKIETKEELETVTARDNSIMPAGFGHLNAAPAQVTYKKNDLKVFSDK